MGSFTQEMRKYGVEATFNFPLTDRGTLDFEATPVAPTTGDTKVIKNEGVAANTDNDPGTETFGVYSLVLTATEMQAARIIVTIVDSATKLWEDHAILITTYGHASAQHAFDLDTAVQTVATTGAGIQGT